MTAVIAESLLPVILIIGVGLGLRESRLVPAEQWRGIELLSYWLLFPALIAYSLIRMDLSAISLGSVAQSYGLAVIVLIAVVWLLRRPFGVYLGIEDPAFGAIFQSATRWNAFIALAIADNLAGDQGLAIVSLLMAITIPILNVANVVVLTICGSRTPVSVAEVTIRTLRVPLIWAAALGLFINLARVPVYEPLLVSCEIAGRAALAVGLLTVGAALRLGQIGRGRVPVVIGTGLKLLLSPLLVFVACRLFQVDGLAFAMMMISAAVPTAMTGYVLARQLGGDAELYAVTASLQVVVSMFTMPVILWLVT